MKKDHAKVSTEDNEKLENPENPEIQEQVETAEETEAVDDASGASQEEIAKLKEEFLRVLAESENIKKRCAAEIEKNNKFAVASFAKDLLVVADNLSRALSAGGENSAECEGVLKGVELTQNELAHVLEKHGIVPIESLGKIFDPNFHRVVQEVEDTSKPAGTIVAELQTGYLINGRILREAMVVVSKGGK